MGAKQGTWLCSETKLQAQRITTLRLQPSWKNCNKAPFVGAQQRKAHASIELTSSQLQTSASTH